jgi:undecaprenyl-diphosphatase
MLAAGAIEMLQELRQPGGADENWSMLVLAAVVSAIVSFAAVKWLLRFVQTHTFIGFGWYRILLGGLLLYFVLR